MILTVDMQVSYLENEVQQLKKSSSRYLGSDSSVVLFTKSKKAYLCNLHSQLRVEVHTPLFFPSISSIPKQSNLAIGTNIAYGEAKRMGFESGHIDFRGNDIVFMVRPSRISALCLGSSEAVSFHKKLF